MFKSKPDVKKPDIKMVVSSVFCGFRGASLFVYFFALFLAFNRSQATKNVAKRGMKGNLLPFIEVLLMIVVMSVMHARVGKLKDVGEGVFIAFPFICLAIMFIFCMTIRVLGLKSDCCSHVINYEAVFEEGEFLGFGSSEQQTIPTTVTQLKTTIKDTVLRLVLAPFFFLLSVIAFLDGIVSTLCFAIFKAGDAIKGSRLGGSAVVDSGKTDAILDFARSFFKESLVLLCLPFYVPEAIATMAQTIPSSRCDAVTTMRGDADVVLQI